MDEVETAADIIPVEPRRYRPGTTVDMRNPDDSRGTPGRVVRHDDRELVVDVGQNGMTLRYAYDATSRAIRSVSIVAHERSDVFFVVNDRSAHATQEENATASARRAEERRKQEEFTTDLDDATLAAFFSAEDAVGTEDCSVAAHIETTEELATVQRVYDEFRPRSNRPGVNEAQWKDLDEQAKNTWRAIDREANRDVRVWRVVTSKDVVVRVWTWLNGDDHHAMVLSDNTFRRSHPARGRDICDDGAVRAALTGLCDYIREIVPPGQWTSTEAIDARMKTMAMSR